jgi:hypothetical protein
MENIQEQQMLTTFTPLSEFLKFSNTASPSQRRPQSENLTCCSRRPFMALIERHFIVGR